MTKEEKDLLAVLFGAATAAALANEDKPEVEDSPQMAYAQAVKEAYDAYIAVGFTEDQATRFVVAQISK